MKTLSVKQPWAWLIVQGIKDVENRSRRTNFRGRIQIHASKIVDYDALLWLEKKMGIFKPKMPLLKDMATGVIIGSVEIVECTQSCFSPWYQGRWGWILSEAKALKTPIPARGHLGLWDHPEIKE
jgi:hypothetical protein